MKLLKRFLLLLLLAIIVVVYINYPRLNILSGYSAKNMASSVFIAKRSAEFTDMHDNNFSPVNIAKDEVNIQEKYAKASVYGLMKRKAIYREGLGSVLINDDFDVDAPYLKPNRAKNNTNLPYPYGNLPQKDTVFANIDYKILKKGVNAAFDNNDVQKTRAVLVIYNDHIIAEKYAEGYNKSSLFLGWSMTKSITATLYGTLQYEGKLNINDAAPVPSWQNDDRKNITLNNLLQMNSGLEWEEDYNKISDVTKMLFLAEDMPRIQEEKPAAFAPNTHWNYSSGTSNLLSGILKTYFKNHQEYLDYPYQALIDRIGMHSMLLEADMSGNYVGSSYSWATPRDWAKFGLLYLHEGNWNGDQLFDKQWATYVSTPAANSGGQYGGHFWLNAGPDNHMPLVPNDAYSANGYQGQRVTIIPSKNMVIVRFGLAEPPEFDFNAFLGGVVKAVK